jgi:hypothetical protein
MTKILKRINLFSVSQQNGGSSDWQIMSTYDGFYWDSSRYDGSVTVSLECWLNAYSGYSASGGIGMISATGSTAYVDGTTATTSSTSRTRAVSSSFSLTDANIYRFMAKYNSPLNIPIYAANLLVAQEGTITKTETKYPLGLTQQGSDSNYIELVNPIVFKYNSTNWGGTTNIHLEAQGEGTTSGITCYWALFDSLGNQISDSEINISGSTYSHAESGSLTLVEGELYRAKVKTTGGTNAARFVVNLSIRQSDMGAGAKTESYIFDPGAEIGTTTSFVAKNDYVYWNNDVWDVYNNVVTMLTAMWNQFGTATSYAELYTSASLAQISTTASKTELAIVESGSLVPADNTIYQGRAKTSDAASDCYYNNTGFKIVSTLTQPASMILAMMIQDD